MKFTTSFSAKHLFIIAGLLQIVWGLVPSASQIVITEIPVELYISLRWTISGILLGGFLFWKEKWIPSIRKETAWVCLLGICGYGLASFGTLYGLKLGGGTNFAMMGALNPMITSLVAILILKEKPLPLFYIALPACILGLVLLVLGKHQVSSWNIAVFSTFLILSAALLEGLIFVFSKKLKLHFTSLQYLAVSQIAAAIFMWFIQLFYFQQFDSIVNLSIHGWMATIFVSVIACVLCYSILYWLLTYMEGHRLALFDGLHTISATAFGILFFHEKMNVLMVSGGVLLLFGLVVGNLWEEKTE